MAKAPAKEEVPVAPKRKSKLVIIIVAALVVVLLLAGGAFWMLKKSSHGEKTTDEPAKSTKQDIAPAFVRLESFTVKLQTFEDKQDQYLQVVPELKVLDAKSGDKIKVYMPELRHNVLLILSSKNANELSSPQGVEKLSVELRSRINSILDGGAGPKLAATDKAGPDDLVQEVLFSSFIIQ